MCCIRLGYQQLQNLSQQSQSTQATQTPSLEGFTNEAIANLIPVKSSSTRSIISGKGGKGSKASSRLAQQQHNQANLQQSNQLSNQFSQLSQPNIPVSNPLSLTNQHLQALKSHLTAVAVSQQAESNSSSIPATLTTTSATIDNTEQVNMSTASILLTAASTSSPTICALGSSMVPTTNVFTLGAPTIPVNLSLTPSASSPPSPGSAALTSNVFSSPITLEMSDGSSSFVLSTPPRLPDDEAEALEFAEGYAQGKLNDTQIILL